MASRELGGNVVELPCVGANVEMVCYNTEYAMAASGHVVDMCLRQGLPREFADIFGQHLQDLNLVISEGDDGSRSFIDVCRVKESSDEPDSEGEWKRIVVLSKNDLIDRKQKLFKAVGRTDLPQPDEIGVEAVVLDWVFYEQAFDALNNACYMQHNYGKYISDFDGQSPNYRAEYTISNEYLKRHPELPVGLEADYVRAKTGFALLLMHDAIVAKGLFPNAKQADWLIRGLAKTVTKSPESFPYTSEEISDHLSIMSPDRNGREKLAAWVMSLDLDLDPGQG